VNHAKPLPVVLHLIFLACAAIACGCGPVVGVKATIRVDEQSQLEREVLGARGEVGRQMVLLPVMFGVSPQRDPGELREMDAEFARLVARLDRVGHPDARVRAWQVVLTHNRAVVLNAMGEVGQSARLLDEALQKCRAYALPTLEWQVLLAQAQLGDGAARAERLRQAAEVALNAPIVADLDYALESPGQRRDLYAALVGLAMEAGQSAQALGYAAQRSALELARAVAPGGLRGAGDGFGRAARELQDARSAAARARDALCRSGEGDAGRADVSARAAYQEAIGRLDEVRARLRDEFAAGGLLVPAPVGPLELQELLTPGTALLMVEPAGGDAYAAFVLGIEAFRAAVVTLPASLVGRLSVDQALAGKLASHDLKAAAGAILGPFAEELTDDIQRLYLVAPPELAGLCWQSLPWRGGRLGTRFQLAFLGGPSDLYWGFHQKRYGRQSILACVGWPDAEESVLRALPDGATVLDVAQASKAEAMRAAAHADLLWLANPVRLLTARPGAGYLAFPGELGSLTGVSIGEFSSHCLRAACAGFPRLELPTYNSDASAAVRVFVRGVMGSGVPSIVCGVGRDRVPDDQAAAYWSGLLTRLGSLPVAEAHRQALDSVDPRWHEAFRLYGFAGMNTQEYAEFSTLEFNDVLRAAAGNLKAGQFEDAASRFQELSYMAQARPTESPAKRALILANIQQYIVNCRSQLRAYDSAARHQELRIDFLAESGQAPAAVMAVEYQSLGALLTKAERFEGAAQAYERSLDLLREHGGDAEVARVLGELGKSLDRATDYERALETFQAALEKYRALDQEDLVALQHKRMGAICLRRLNNAPRAEEHFREAVRVYRLAGRQAEAVEATIDLGLCRRRLGDLAGAIEMFEDALSEAEGADLPRPTARALTEVANTRWLRGEYQQALELVGRSNDLASRAGADFQLNVNYQLMGLIYWQLNRYEQAHRALEKAVESAERAEDPLEVASARNNQGIVYRRQGRYREALDSFAAALAVDRRLGTRWGQAYDHRNIGITLHRMGRLDEAAADLERAVELSREIGDRVNLTKALLALGELRFDQAQLDQARTLLDDALGGARDIYLPEVEWRALRALGRLHRAQGDNAAALDAFKVGVEVVEQLRGAIRVDELRSGFLSNKMDLYEDTVRLLLDLDRPGEAFTYTERSRSRKFMDLVQRQDIQLKTERERKAYGRLQDLDRRMRALHESIAAEQDAARRGELAGQLDETGRQYADALLEVRLANPDLSAFVTVDAVAASEVAEFLPQGVALVACYLMEDELALWVWRDGQMYVRRVPLKRDDLAGRIRDYRILVQNRELLDDVRAASEGLDSLLLEPVRGLLAGSTAVGIVPHRALHYLSFASLYDGEAFLVERYPLFYSPSVSVLRRALESEPAVDKSALNVLAMGNPAVGDRAYELPFTEREVASIQRDFAKVTPMTGEEATEDWLREHAGEFDIVHIGAHGRFDAVNPLLSSLLLAPLREDGQLQLREVTGLALNARLATLSACQSGLGSLDAADELVSLSRAFAYAGARSILSTLWRVDDVSTALIVKHFYRHYSAHGAAESLRHAQLQVMNDGRHYHPGYWAGMVLTGDFR